MKLDARVHLVISELAPGGDGVAHLDHEGTRRAIFVRRAAIGDEMHADVDWTTRPARALSFAITRGGDGRVDPACPVAAVCGGCNWLHLTHDSQRRAHVEIVSRSLPDAWRAVPITSHEAPEKTRYRTRARLHATARKKARRGEPRVVVGMFAEKSHDPVETDVCLALAPALDHARLGLAALFDGAIGAGEVELAFGAFPARLPVLAIAWRGELASETFGRLERGVREGAWQGAHVALDGAARPLVIGDPTPWITAADGAPLALAPAGFAQSSDAGNALLATHVSTLVSTLLDESAARGDHEPASIVELYAGAGNLTVLLARDAKHAQHMQHTKVHAIESDGAACDAARKNLASRGLIAKVTCGDARTFAWPKETRVLVLDPPRTGAREVAERLVSSPVPRVVYVSCDPTTLGRDLATLAARYRPRSIDTFEMFPRHKPR